MNRVYKTIALMALVTMIGVACSGGNGLKVESQTIELGQVSDNDNEYPIVKIYNSTSKDIEIDTIIVSTRTIGIREQLKIAKAKDTTLLELSVMTDRMDGEFAALVSIYVKGNEKPLDVVVKGNVKATPKNVEEICKYQLCKAKVNKINLNFGEVPLGKEVHDTIMVYNPTDKIMSVYPLSVPANVKLSQETRYVRPNKVGYICVTYKATEIDQLGLKYDMLRLDVGHELCYDDVITIEANVQETFDHLTKEQLANAPVLQIDNPEHNFGELKQGVIAKHIFKLSNKGKTPLVIRWINSTCGCTVAKLAKKVIAPSETIDVEVTFDSEGRLGTQQKVLTVVSNAPNAANQKLWITATIVK